MRPRHVLVVIALIFGSWLVVDAMTAIATGSYTSLSTGGQWMRVLRWTNIEPVSFAPGVLSLGMLWLISAIAAALRHSWWRGFFGTTAAMSLWYLPIGSFLSMISLVVILSGLLPRRRLRRSALLGGIILSIGVTIVLQHVLTFAGGA